MYNFILFLNEFCSQKYFPYFVVANNMVNVKFSVLYLHDPQGRWSGTYLSIQTVSQSVSTYWFPLNKYLSWLNLSAKQVDFIIYWKLRPSLVWFRSDNRQWREIFYIIINTNLISSWNTKRQELQFYKGIQRYNIYIIIFRKIHSENILNLVQTRRGQNESKST